MGRYSEKKKSKLDASFYVSGGQCEQKWNNITKQYRDTIDHNNKSGNDHKECPFYNELNEANGYGPNVKPMCLKGSMIVQITDQNDDVEDSDSLILTVIVTLCNQQQANKNVLKWLRKKEKENRIV